MENKEQIIKTLEESPTMSNRDIALKIGISRGAVQYWLRKLGVQRDRISQQKINNTNRNKVTHISEAAKEILIGTLLGDSYISSYKRDCEPKKILNSRISCGHSIKQRHYVLYLKMLLEGEGLKVNYTKNNKIYTSNIQGRVITSIGRCDLSTSRNIEFNSWRDLWYPNGYKTVPREIESSFSPLSLAIWYMDDGSKNNSSYFLHTEGFLIEDVIFLQSVLLNKFNIKTSINYNRGRHLIHIKAESRELFTTLIKSYVCESMKYKLIEHNIGSEKMGRIAGTLRRNLRQSAAELGKYIKVPRRFRD